MVFFHIGFDDTDSLKSGCTTYVAALLIEKLAKEAIFVDYPNLIRLNPNIPWKSRGNAAVCLRIESKRSIEEIIEIATFVVEENRDREDPKNQPGIAVLEGEVPLVIKEFGKKALYDVLSLEGAVQLSAQAGIVYRLIKGGRGLVGAIAAIGNTLEMDHTFELAVYRKKSLWGKRRQVDLDSVIKMDKDTAPFTFNNFDYEKERVLITPHGPDPILFGIRGENPAILLKAFNEVKFEGGERWAMYRSNQGTDAHLICKPKVNELKPFQAAVVEGIVTTGPQIIIGGHVILSITDGTAEVDVAAYEPSGGFRMVVNSLRVGDMVKVYGGVRSLGERKLTFNLEKLEVVDLAEDEERNPLCPYCNKRMKSEGKDKGYQCKKCGKKFSKTIFEKVNRELKERIYLPPSRAMRHLTKPMQRYGMEKCNWDGDVRSFYGIF